MTASYFIVFRFAMLHVCCELMLALSDNSTMNVPEADVEDCCRTGSVDGIDDASCSDILGFVCEYDVFGANHSASNTTAAGVVLRGSYIEVGFNGNGSIGIKYVLCSAPLAFVCVMLFVESCCSESTPYGFNGAFASTYPWTGVG